MKPRIFLVAAALLLAAGAAHAETFDFYVFTYCPTSDPLCGFASQAAYKEYIQDAVQNMNLEWERAGISFRPLVLNIQVNDYYAVSEGCNGDVSDEVKDRRQEWKANVAGVFPNAVSVMMTPGGSWCCSHIPGTPYGAPEKDVYPALFGMFCSMSWDSFTLGSILGHEAGHYFCLVHTQTFQDIQSHGPTPDHDNDDCCSIADTSADPARREGWKEDSPTAGDIDADGNPVNGHEWCTNQPLDGLTDDGSPHPQMCQPVCYLYQNNMQTVSGFQPPSNASMSYYMAGCHGPYVVNGQTSYAFSDDSVAQVRDVCIPQVPERAALPDVCVGYGGDTDNDGICNAQDNCPGDKNTSQKNTDGDAWPDGCDPCPLDPNPTGDQDGDGVGDICDPDKDGDTCDDDTIDEDPDNGKVHLGYTFNSDCGFGIEPVYASASVDTDGDGFKGCEDVDNDNDEICDGPASHGPGEGAPPGGCAAGPDPCTETAGLGCYAIQGSPTLCPPSWLDCIGGGCLEFFLKIVSVINPADEVVLDGHFSILNRTIFAAPVKETTLSQTGKALAGDFSGVQKVAELGAAGGGVGAGGWVATGGMATVSASASIPQATAPGRVRLEIWRRAGGLRVLARFVAVVGEYDPSQVTLGDLSRGALLEITPSTNAAGAPRLEVKATYADVPPSPVQPPPDGDHDSRPDAFDNCVAVDNFLQNDADGDGFGNACDADIDGDLLVDDADVAAVRGCLGADLAYDSPIAEPGDDEGSPPPDPDLIALKMRCGAMDLDGDARVGASDEAIALGLLGRPPGPSSRALSATRCEPAGCDDGKACTHDFCDRAGGACMHVPRGCDDGDPCTQDSCDLDTGACRNVPIACDDGDPCTRDFCDQAAGGCTSAPEPEGAVCDDGSVCTAGETCRAGACGGGTPSVCDDADPCTVDACDPVSGACVVAGGTCDDGNPCTRDTCDGRAGTCTHDVLPDGEACSDGDACTVGDICRDGQCASQPKSCDDGNLCTDDLCVQPSGLCAHVPRGCLGPVCMNTVCVPSTGECVTTPVTFAQASALEVSGAGFTVTWTGPAGARWSGYRGGIPSALMGSRSVAYDHVCLETLDFMEDGPTLSMDPGMPERGTAFYYVVSERNDCGEGAAGHDSTGAARPNPSPCLAGP